MIQAGDSGTRLAIRLLQDAAERGDIEPWDVDVIAVVDGFLDQLRQKLELPRLIASAGGSYEQDLAESSEAFLAASVLVSLKAEHLEASTFQAAEVDEDDVDLLLASRHRLQRAVQAEGRRHRHRPQLPGRCWLLNALL